MNSPTELRISDIHLVAFLVARGFAVRRTDGPPGRREFVFRDIPEATVLSFYGDDDQVSARALLDALRNVRGLLAQRLSHE